MGSEIAVEVIDESPLWDADALGAWAAAAAGGVAARMGVSGEVALLACDDARIAGLNARFRDKPAPTNVLSWPAEEVVPPDLPRGPELGDVAIAHETCTREAAAQGKTLEAHVTHLLVHGMLHLLGYDHEDEAEALAMEALEREILGNLGWPDPY
ncbi:MAG: rRNA maturation RNase YbeY [Shimia sp.]